MTKIFAALLSIGLVSFVYIDGLKHDKLPRPFCSDGKIVKIDKNGCFKTSPHGRICIHTPGLFQACLPIPSK